MNPVNDQHTRHTSKPVVDVESAIPELVRLAKTTVRLHPRRGECADDDSKMGGKFIWPANEPWPHCKEHNCPYVGLLQVRLSDVPELGFRNDADLFQLLWCPNDHETIQPLYAPASQIFWRRRSEILNALSSIPPARANEDWYLPAACVVHPERVTEYPHACVISDDFPQLWNQIKSSRQLNQAMEVIAEYDFHEAGTLYHYWLSVADGTKIGGYPNWIQDLQSPKCLCGKEMEYLLTVASAEFDGGTWGRWLAVEDRHVWGSDYEQRNAVQRAASLMLGDMGNLNYFVCRQCEDWPISSVFQCS